MNKAYKFRIYPNKKQTELINKTIGCCRWVYNWALEKKKTLWEKKHKNISSYELIKQLPILKKDLKTKWLNDACSQALQQSILHLENAYNKFFKEHSGFPKFKNKRDNRQNFSVPCHISLDRKEHKIKLYKFGKIDIVLHRKFKGNIKNVTISRTPSGKYFASVCVEVKDKKRKLPKITKKTTIGIDVGIKNFAVLSDGRVIDNPRFAKRVEKKIARAQRRLSRKVKGSKNRNKQRIRVAKIYEKIQNKHNYFLHKLTHNIVGENQTKTIVVEDLKVRNMVKNRCLAKSISDCSWSRFVEFLKYKCEWSNKNFIKIGTFQPSSKKCSVCGEINKDLTLADREWTCSKCGTVLDRDQNASQNIKMMGIRQGLSELTLGESRGIKTTRRNQETNPARG